MWHCPAHLFTGGADIDHLRGEHGSRSRGRARPQHPARQAKGGYRSLAKVKSLRKLWTKRADNSATRARVVKVVSDRRVTCRRLTASADRSEVCRRTRLEKLPFAALMMRRRRLRRRRHDKGDVSDVCTKSLDSEAGTVTKRLAESWSRSTGIDEDRSSDSDGNSSSESTGRESLMGAPLLAFEIPLYSRFRHNRRENEK